MYFGLPQEIIKKIIEVFANTKEIKKAVIFGSRARGDYEETSDIDIGLYLEEKLDVGVFDGTVAKNVPVIEYR